MKAPKNVDGWFRACSHTKAHFYVADAPLGLCGIGGLAPIAARRVDPLPHWIPCRRCEALRRDRPAISKRKAGAR